MTYLWLPLLLAQLPYLYTKMLEYKAPCKHNRHQDFHIFSTERCPSTPFFDTKVLRRPRWPIFRWLPVTSAAPRDQDPSRDAVVPGGMEHLWMYMMMLNQTNWSFKVTRKIEGFHVVPNCVMVCPSMGTRYM